MRVLLVKPQCRSIIQSLSKCCYIVKFAITILSADAGSCRRAVGLEARSRGIEKIEDFEVCSFNVAIDWQLSE